MEQCAITNSNMWTEKYLYLIWVQKEAKHASHHNHYREHRHAPYSFSFKSFDFHLRPFFLFNHGKQLPIWVTNQIPPRPPQTIQLAAPSAQLWMCAKCIKVTQLMGHLRSFQNHGNKPLSQLIESEILYLNAEFRKLLGGGRTAVKCSHGKPSYTFTLMTEGSRVAAVPHLTNGTASLKVYLWNREYKHYNKHSSKVSNFTPDNHSTFNFRLHLRKQRASSWCGIHGG